MRMVLIMREENYLENVMVKENIIIKMVESIMDHGNMVKSTE
jgi:hypothetical protein